jgi:hypothetical protein
MGWLSRGWLLVGTACCTAAQSGAVITGSPEAVSRITVLVYNYAGISVEAVTEAERAAGRIFENAGIETDWLNCPPYPDQAKDHPACLVTPGPAKLILRIAAGSMARKCCKSGSGFC